MLAISACRAQSAPGLDCHAQADCPGGQVCDVEQQVCVQGLDRDAGAPGVDAGHVHDRAPASPERDAAVGGEPARADAAAPSREAPDIT
ncbi:MAG: hypothetical protein ABW321_31460 [Polyangiales bacterium]